MGQIYGNFKILQARRVYPGKGYFFALTGCYWPDVLGPALLNIYPNRFILSIYGDAMAGR